MSWTGPLANPQWLDALYDETEGLERISLHSVSLHRDGPCLRIRADLARYPDRPSPRWPAEADTAQVVLACWGIRDLVLRGAATTAEGVLDVERLDDGTLAVRFEAPGMEISAGCDFLRVESLTAYASERSGASLAAEDPELSGS